MLSDHLNYAILILSFSCECWYLNCDKISISIIADFNSLTQFSAKFEGKLGSLMFL